MGNAKGSEGNILSNRMSQVRLNSPHLDPRTSRRVTVSPFDRPFAGDEESSTPLADDDEKDFLLSQELFSTPDYITPDDQQIMMGLDGNKENVPCPASPEKSTSLRIKRCRPESFSINSPGPNQACLQKTTLKGEVLGSVDSATRQLSGSGQRKKRNYVSALALALYAFSHPECIINPYLPENEELNNRFGRKKPSRYSAIAASVNPLHVGAHTSRYCADFIELEKIGHGSFSNVYKVVKKIDGCCYAVKCSARPLLQDSEKVRALMEVQALAALGYHQNVVGYYTSWFENDLMYIQMELCERSLAVTDPPSTAFLTSEKDFIEVMYQIAQALEFIHERGVAHLDLKPENVYVRGGTYKLGDFGRATLIDGSLRIEEGDARYMPTEIINDRHDHLDKADIFSLGASIYELVTNHQLALSGDQYQLIRQGKISLLPGLSIQFQNLLKEMLDPDPVKRPSAKALLNNPIFKKIQGVKAPPSVLKKV